MHLDDVPDAAADAAADDALEARMARYRARAGAAAFDAGFADRVMARLAPSRGLADGLYAVFMRVMPMAIAAVLVLTTMNLLSSRATRQSLVDRMLGLSSVTVASASSPTSSFDGDLSEWGR